MDHDLLSGTTAERSREATSPTTIVGEPTSVSSALRRAGLIAGFLAIACAAVQMTVEVIAVAVLDLPVPNSVEGWLQSLVDRRLITLVELTVLQIPLFALLALVLLGLATTLMRTPALTVTSMTLGLLGISVYLASNPALGLATLSDQYATAVDPSVRATAVASATALLALYDGIGLDVGSLLVLLAVGGLSVAMWRDGQWHRGTAALGIIAAAGSGMYYVAIPLGPSRIFILEIASVLFLAWVLMVTLGLNGGRIRALGTHAP